MLLIFIAGSALGWEMSKAMSSLIFAMELRFCYPYIAIPVLLGFVGVLLFGLLLVWVLVWFGLGQWWGLLFGWFLPVHQNKYLDLKTHKCAGK